MQQDEILPLLLDPSYGTTNSSTVRRPANLLIFDGEPRFLRKWIMKYRMLLVAGLKLTEFNFDLCGTDEIVNPMKSIIAAKIEKTGIKLVI
jgi:hypothetical protein